MKRRLGAAILVKVGLLGVAAASGCAVLADLDHTYEPTGGSGGPGGAGGSGGGGAGGSGACEPGELRPCYTGPEGTKSVGACKGGLETCDASGSGWGACVGETVPVAETCDTPFDDDCDMMVNEEGVGCSCTPGTMLPCYSGPAGTENNLPCKAGTQMCNETGVGFGACMGEVAPLPEDCSTPADDDCDAVETNGDPDVDSFCKCIPGGPAVACYTGPSGTKDVGECKGGTQTCNPDGKDFGPCMGEIKPAVTENCATKDKDEDCNGVMGELCPGETQWSKSGGDGTDQEATDVAVDAAGNVIVVGGFDGTLAFGAPLVSAGSRDIFVAKFGPTGAHLWSNRYGGSGYDTARSVAVNAAGDIVVVGTFDSPMVDFGAGPKDANNTDAFVLKLNGNGAHQWSMVYGPNGPQFATSVAVASGGDVYVCGSYGGPSDFGTGNIVPGGGALDYFLLKLAGGNGASVWAKGFGDSGNQSACSVAVDSVSNPVIAVPLVGTVDFGGGPLTAQGTDVGVAKFNPNGGHTWSKKFGDGTYQDALSVVVDSQDRVLVTGQFQGNVNFGGGALTANGTDAYVARFTSAGAYDLQKAIGVADYQRGVDVGVGENNSIVVVGDFDNAISFGAPSVPVMNAGSDKGYAVKYDVAGTYVWGRAITGNGVQQPVAVATTKAGDVALAGWFKGTIDLGGAGNQHTNMGSSDVFVALLLK